MLHARKDYNRRVQDSENIIPEDEPVFLIRGQDIHAPIILEIYALLVSESDAPNQAIIDNTKKHAERMRQWHEDCNVKYPNMPESESVPN